MKRFLGLVALGLSVVPSAAKADDCTAPCLAYDLSLSLYDETTLVDKPAGTQDNSVLGPSNSLTLTATPVDGLNVVADLINEPVLDPVPGKLNAFKGVGLYADELYAEYSGETFYLQAGKFGPPFSMASAELGGNYGSTFASNFDTDERWGALAAYDFSAGETKQRISAAAFTSDRTFLSESAFTNRAPGGLHLSDGGAGNTSGISSALLLWDGCAGAAPPDCYSDGDWGYRVGLRWQDTKLTEDGDPGKDEWSTTGALYTKGSVAGHDVKILAEADYTPHLGGSEDGLMAATLGTEWDFDPVTLYAAVNVQNTIHPAAANTTGFGIDLAASYALNDEWTLDAGYAYVDTGEDDAAHYLNLSVTYEITGGTGSKN